MNKKYKIGLLMNKDNQEYKSWLKSLDKKNQEIEYKVIDIFNYQWLNQLKEFPADLFLTRPPGLSSNQKNLYDERIWVINKVLRLKIYPSYEEIYVYENKKLLSYFLAAKEIPHPKTYIFYKKQEALDTLSSVKLPIVGKFNIGASGYGIRILNTKSDYVKYINQAFSNKGISRKWGPNFKYRNWKNRIERYFKGERSIRDRLKNYQMQKSEAQRGFVIIQEYIPHEFEWRGVRIGESYFAHKKVKKGKMTSGSLIKSYDNPPLYLMNFIKDISNKINFSSAAFDLFEFPQGSLWVNEIQCFFGQSDPFQMKVDNTPGKYRYFNNEWIFEPGDFCSNECYDLRLEHALSLIQRT